MEKEQKRSKRQKGEGEKGKIMGRDNTRRRKPRLAPGRRGKMIFKTGSSRGHGRSGQEERKYGKRMWAWN